MQRKANGRDGSDTGDLAGVAERSAFGATSPTASAVGYRPPAGETALVPEQTISASRICASRL